ncbi:MAG: CHAT domain-containing protein [Cyanobacteria bacterium P01_D01_bin.156]
MVRLFNRHHTASLLITFISPVALVTTAQAQSITSADNATTVQQIGDQYQIDGGNVSGDSTTLIHSFDQFGLLTGESAQFSNAATIENIIGRITGGDASIIDGLLAVDGNANLYLLNPSGIFFGENTQLNLAGSFSASTATGLNFGDELLDTLGTNDYASLTGAPTGYEFATETGALINTGDLAVTSGQSLTLLGGQVINTGQLSSGEVLVMAVPGENRVRLSQSGSLLGLELETLPNAAPTAAFTASTVPALLTGAGDLGMATDITVNADGSVSLSGSSLQIPMEEGTAVVSGQLTTDGGNVGVLGEQIALVGAAIDASGDAGGGTVLIGGDELGNGSVPNAEATVIDKNSVVLADARDTGNGGKIVAWGTNLLRSAGQLFARGGVNGGDGGFIETSSLGQLEVSATPDVSAVNGIGGLWLLDPATIRIVAGSGATNISNTNPFIVGGDITDALLGVDLITAALQGGNTVEIRTTGTTPGDGNITLETPLDYDDIDNSSLTLSAAGSIDIQADIIDGEVLVFDPVSSTESPDEQNLTLTLLANEQININGNIETGTGALTIISDQGNIDITRRLVTTSGDVSIRAPEGRVTISNVIHTSLDRFSEAFGLPEEQLIADTPGGDVTVSARRAIAVGDIITSSNGDLAGSISLESQISTIQTGKILANISDSVDGNITVAINHGGGDFLPFKVGDNSINGTAGVISLGNDIVFENRSFLGSSETPNGNTTLSFAPNSIILFGDETSEGLDQATELATGEIIGRFDDLNISIENSTGQVFGLMGDNFPDISIDDITGEAFSDGQLVAFAPLRADESGDASVLNALGVDSSVSNTLQLLPQTEPEFVRVLEESTDIQIGEVQLGRSLLTGLIFPIRDVLLPVDTTSSGFGPVGLSINAETGFATAIGENGDLEVVGKATMGSLDSILEDPVTGGLDLSLLAGSVINLRPEVDLVEIPVIDELTGQSIGKVTLNESRITGNVFNPVGSTSTSLLVDRDSGEDIVIDATTGLATTIDNGQEIVVGEATMDLSNSILVNPGTNKVELSGLVGNDIELVAATVPVEIPVVDFSTNQTLGQVSLSQNGLTGEIINSGASPLSGQLILPETMQSGDIEIDLETGSIADLSGNIVGQVLDTSQLTSLTADGELEIALLLPPANVPQEGAQPQVLAPEEIALSCITDCYELETSSDSVQFFGGEIDVLPEPELAFQYFEQQITQEVANYLGIEASGSVTGEISASTESSTTLDLPKAKARLKQAQAQTGKRPALIYAVFGNAEEGLDNVLQSTAPLDPLELLLVTADGEPIYIQLPANRRDVLALAHRFRRQVASPSRVGTQSYLSIAQELYQLLIAPLAAELAAQEIDTISFITDAGLRSLPLAALHDGENFLIENYNIGLMPSLTLTDFTYKDIRDVDALVAGTSVFSDQIHLPSVPVELNAISSQWRSALIQGDTFNLETLKGERQTNGYGILHLATHGEFNPGDLSKSYLHLHNDKLGLHELRTLGLHKPGVELITLSACQTALGSRTAELGFAGFAVLTGAKTAVASLWNISDDASAGLMIEFYQQLQGSQPTIKAEALRQAQLAMLRGQITVENDQLKLPSGNHSLPTGLGEDAVQDFSHPYYWAAFNLVGSPW